MIARPSFFALLSLSFIINVLASQLLKDVENQLQPGMMPEKVEIYDAYQFAPSVSSLKTGNELSNGSTTDSSDDSDHSFNFQADTDSSCQSCSEFFLPVVHNFKLYEYAALISGSQIMTVSIDFLVFPLFSYLQHANGKDWISLDKLKDIYIATVVASFFYSSCVYLIYCFWRPVS